MSRLCSLTQRFTGRPDSGCGSVWHSSCVRKVQEHPSAGLAFLHSCAVGLFHQGVQDCELEGSMATGVSLPGFPARTWLSNARTP